jgi:2-polyprenyl-3-methyl-5-hydroxy-6-metoxy-1,4-benzoquinol methylase
MSSKPNCPLCGSSSTKAIYSRYFQGRTWALVRCRHCGLHFTQPAPSSDQITRFYSGDYHSELRTPNVTERLYGPKYGRYLQWLQQFQPSGRVLDVGCATGLLVRMLCDCGYQAEGIEIDTETARWGRQYYGVTIHSVPLEECFMQTGTFDAVMLTDIVEHTRDPLEFLRNIGQLLVVGGYALVTFPDILSAESRYFRLLARLTGRPWLWGCCRTPKHIWEFTKPTASTCFERAGFQIVAFQRTQRAYIAPAFWKMRIVSAPTALLSWPMMAKYFGTQMEFMIRRVAKPSDH